MNQKVADSRLKAARQERLLQLQNRLYDIKAKYTDARYSYETAQNQYSHYRDEYDRLNRTRKSSAIWSPLEAHQLYEPKLYEAKKAMNKAKKDMDTYLEQVRKYQDKMDKAQKEVEEYAVNNGLAISRKAM